MCYRWIAILGLVQVVINSSCMVLGSAVVPRITQKQSQKSNVKSVIGGERERKMDWRRGGGYEGRCGVRRAWREERQTVGVEER